MKKTKITIILILILVTTGCRSAIVEFLINKGINNYNQMKTYEGTILEKGVLDNEDIISIVKYKKPDLIMTKTISPESLKDDCFAYDGKNIYIFNAQLKLGILISGINDVIPDSHDTIQARLKQNALRIANEYDVSYKGRRQLAGRSTHYYHLMCHHKHNRYAPKEKVWNDVEFAMPLKVIMNTTNDELFYSFEFKTITFNPPMDIKEFQYRFPPGTIVAKWNLGGKNYSLTEIKHLMNFPVQSPHFLPSSMKRIKIVKAEGPIPAACFIFSDGMYHILLSEIKSFGLMIDKQKGISIPSIKHHAKLNFFGEEIVVSWIKDNVQLMLSSNLPYDQVIGIAENISED